MMSQVSFTTDENLKIRALEKAKLEGITLKALLTYAMKSFVDGKISLSLYATQQEPDVEELFLTEEKIIAQATKLAKQTKRLI